MTDQDHIVQVVVPDVRDDGVNAVPVCNPNALICWAMTNKCWSVGMVPLCLEMANDSLPGPTAMPCSVNHYKCFVHNVLLMTRVPIEYSHMLLISTGTVSYSVPMLFLF